MHIGVDIRALMEKELTGVGEYTFHLLKHLFELDSKNHYYLFYNSRQDVSKYIPKFPKDNVHYCSFKLPNKLLNVTLKLFGHPELDRAIQIKYKTPKLDLFFFPNITFLKTRCPYIITAHDLSYHLFPEFLSLKRKLWHKFINPRKIFKNADKVLAVSQNTKQDLINQYNISSKKIQTIYSGISLNYKKISEHDPKLNKIKTKYKLPKKFVLYLGTIEPRKNINSLITAFEEFNKKFPDYHLVISGKPGWKYKDMMQKINNNPKILFTNFIQDQEKRYFYNLASMFIFPSYYEGFGFPPLEAMACECPVITSNNSSMSEVCRNAAILIDPYNINDLVQAMTKFTKSETAQFFIAKGKERAKEFNWYKTANEILHFMS
jgi:glycosyltransferase involved in cell wall biosynthesis